MFQPIFTPPEVGPAATAAVMDLLRLLADPAATQARIDKLVAARDEAIAAAQALVDLTAALDNREKETAAAAEAGRKQLEDAAAALRLEREAFAAEQADHFSNVEAHAAERERLAEREQKHAATVAAHLAAIDRFSSLVKA